MGEVEIHYHHERDTSEGLRKALVRFRDMLASDGFLSKDRNGKVGYAFVHGNWALDNSLPDGRWCGVNDELTVLKETGCFADFTLPSAPSPAQTRMVNSIYYAKDDPFRSRSHDRGVPVTVGQPPSGDLMIIQGPLALDWRRRKYGIVPRIENGSIHSGNPPTPSRVNLWVRQRISVRGREEWVFVKVYTHGCQEPVMEVVLGKPMVAMHKYLQTGYNDGNLWKLHYVTAREMYNIIRAAEAGETGNPGEYRNYIFSR